MPGTSPSKNEIKYYQKVNYFKSRLTTHYPHFSAVFTQMSASFFLTFQLSKKSLLSTYCIFTFFVVLQKHIISFCEDRKLTFK